MSVRSSTALAKLAVRKDAMRKLNAYIVKAEWLDMIEILRRELQIFI